LTKLDFYLRVDLAEKEKNIKVFNEAKLHLGVIEYKLNNLEESINLLSDLIKDSPESYEAYYFRGLSYIGLN